ncbi:MAG TPA: tRNA epoxyqueuosine(34) reductase QueG [Ktedonobacterales bacterium]|nr:tRNA epoxyqueuosine(34) reductase QueG [Ktedonobacterales bacterium]
MTQEQTAIRHDRTQRIVAAAEDLGFDLVRVTSADPFPAARQAIQERVALGFFAGMDWFTSERAEVAADPHALLPTARSVIALGTFYLTDAPRDLTAPGDPHGRISSYAWGEDYHEVIKARLHALADLMRAIAAEEGVVSGETRLFVDTGRMVDRAVAQRSGMGWYGKNTNILSRQWGSWLFLAEIVTDLDLEPDPPIAATCGHCRVCLDACPTQAFVAPGVLDATRCISYLTIEHRGAIPLELRPLIGNHIFGCDICQEVCPVNLVVERRLRARGELGPGSAGETRRAHFTPRQQIGPSPALIPLLALDEDGFRERFRRSPIKRAKRRGLVRNVCVALGNLRDPVAIPALTHSLRHDPEPLVRGHAAWALGCIGGADARLALQDMLAIETAPEVIGEIRYALAMEEGLTP